MEEQFTKYEVARIIGARALQIAMDAPLLMKIPKEKLEEMKYDSLRIAEHEFESGVLPISINRPTPQFKKGKLAAVKEEKVSDKELVEKEKEIEKEAEEMGLAEKDEDSIIEEESTEEN